MPHRQQEIGEIGPPHAHAHTVADGDGPVQASTTPASGSLFPLGATTVNVTARDARANTATGSFTVYVLDTTAPVLAPPSPI